MQACDPKLMELAFGRALFDAWGRYAADPADIADLLEDAVADMQARARRFAGRQRDHTPTEEFPFVVVLVDEIAFLTAYQADRKLRTASSPRSRVFVPSVVMQPAQLPKDRSPVARWLWLVRAGRAQAA